MHPLTLFNDLFHLLDVIGLSVHLYDWHLELILRYHALLPTGHEIRSASKVWYKIGLGVSANGRANDVDRFLTDPIGIILIFKFYIRCILAYFCLCLVRLDLIVFIDLQT